MNQVTAGLWLIGRLLYRALMLWLWLLLLFYLGFKLAERGQAIDALPAQLEVEGVVLIGGESGIREGCGVAVLRLSSAMRVRLQREGLAALQEAEWGSDRHDHGADQSDPQYIGCPLEAPLRCA